MSETETLRLPSRFDYGHHRQFTDLYLASLENANVKSVVLDFSNVEYLDSAALGMMVLMQKRFKEKNKMTKITGATGATEEILKMANMNKIFEFV